MPNMPRTVVFDTGPLVALFDRHDRFHNRAIDFINAFRGDGCTNLAVVTETMYLLDFRRQAQLIFLDWVGSGAIQLVSLSPTDLLHAKELMGKYADLPMDFADACVVTLCERLETPLVATIDRDFGIYRFRGRGSFENIFLGG